MPIKSGLITTKILQRLRVAFNGSLPKCFQKQSPCPLVDHAAALCWDAAMQTINFTAVLLFSRLLNVSQSADRSLIQISLWLEGETRSILLCCQSEQ